MNVTCTNEECPERNVIKTNPLMAVTVDEIRCGECGQRVEERTE